jgi:hypothetical protein
MELGRAHAALNAAMPPDLDPVDAALLVGAKRRHHAGVDKNADGDRHFFPGDQVIEDDWDAPCAVVFDISAAILEDHDACRPGAVVLGGDVDPVIARGAGEDFAGGELISSDLALRDIGLALRIRTEGVFFGAEKAAKEKEDC